MPREDAPAWIKLVPVLKALNEKHRHAFRFLDPEVEGAKIWAKSDGGIPEEDIEWKRMKGPEAAAVAQHLLEGRCTSAIRFSNQSSLESTLGDHKKCEIS